MKQTQLFFKYIILNGISSKKVAKNNTVKCSARIYIKADYQVTCQLSDQMVRQKINSKTLKNITATTLNKYMNPCYICFITFLFLISTTVLQGHLSHAIFIVSIFHNCLLVEICSKEQNLEHLNRLY